MTSVTLTPPRSGSGDFATLSREVRHAGLLDRRRGYYLIKIIANLAVFAAGWVAFMAIGDSWWQLLTAVFFAFMYTQLAFIGHHANPNHEDDDPDLDIPALAFTRDQARHKRGPLRWMAKHQAALFFPLLLLEGLNLHWSSIKHVWHGDGRTRGLEAGLLITHLVAYLTAVFTVLSPLTGLAFIAVHQGLWGVYMGCSFAPRHSSRTSATATASTTPNAASCAPTGTSCATCTQLAPHSVKKRRQRRHDTTMNHALEMKPAGAAIGSVDGGWWPRSHDPTTAFPELVSALIPEQRWEAEDGYVRNTARHPTASPSPARFALPENFRKPWRQTCSFSYSYYSWPG